MLVVSCQKVVSKNLTKDVEEMYMSNKDRIIDLYFNEKYKPTEIAKALNISNAYITKIIKKDPRYIDEKTSRKLENKTKNISETKKYIKQQRENNSILEAYMRQQHIQATMELSGGHGINNRAFRKWNSSAYNYNDKKKCFVFNKRLGRSYAVPKYVK